MRCQHCDVLQVRIVELEATVRALRLMVRDMGGLSVVDDGNPEEVPLVVWEDDK